MSTAEQAAKAEAFRALHRGPRLLLMANAWDAVSARIFEAEGFAAVEASSAAPCPGQHATADRRKPMTQGVPERGITAGNASDAADR